MITRTARETVMLEALELLCRHCSCLRRRIYGVCDYHCASEVAARAIATVKAMDEAELAAGAGTP